MADLSQYDQIFTEAGNEWNVDPTLLKAMAKQESGGRTNAVSPKGAVGLMQIIPETQRYLGITDPNDPVQSIYGAAKYMNEALDKEGTPERALLYYHGGPGWRNAYGPESRAYVPAVTAHYVALKPQSSEQQPPASTAPAPAPAASTSQGPLILGDSLASKGGLGGSGVVGAHPKAVLDSIAGLPDDQVQGRDVVLSSGASNNPAQAGLVYDQVKALKAKGANSVTVVGVGDRPDFQGVNDQLALVTGRAGGQFVPLDTTQLSPDRVHPTAAGYKTLLAAATPKVATDATPAPAAPTGAGKTMANDDLPSWLPAAPKPSAGVSATPAATEKRPDDLPSWLPAAPQPAGVATKPSIDFATRPMGPQPDAGDLGLSLPQASSPALDRITGAAGQAYTASPPLLSPGAENWLNQTGPINRYLTVPAAKIVGGALATGAALGAGGMAAVGETATALGAPGLGRDINMLTQVAPIAAAETAPMRAAMRPLRVPEGNALSPKFVGERTAPPREPGATDLERIQQLIRHDEAEAAGAGPDMKPAPSTPGAGRSATEDTRWVGNTASEVQRVVQENAAAGGPANLSAAATPEDLARMTPAQVKAHRRMAELNQIVSPIEGEDNVQYVRGSNPTEAERMGHPATSQKEVMTRQRNPDAFEGENGILTKNDRARVHEFDETLLSDTQAADLKIAQQKAASEAQGRILSTAKPVDLQAAADWINAKLADPLIQEDQYVHNSLKQLRERLYDADGNLKTDPRAVWGMHNNLRNKLLDAKDPMSANPSEKYAVTQVNEFKKLVDGALDVASDGQFRAHLDQQAEFLKSLNAWKLMNDFRYGPNKMINAKTGMINANAFHRFVTDLAIRRGRPGIDAAMDIPDNVFQRLINIDQDLKRAGRIDLGKPRGSPTNLFFELAGALGIAGAHAITAAATAGTPFGGIANVGMQTGISAVQRRLGQRRLNQLTRQALEPPPGGFTPAPGNPLNQQAP